ncbi:MAG: hypothetical protein AB8C84_03690 [Oligoflexales bacterium]
MQSYDGARSPRRFMAYLLWIVGVLAISSLAVRKKENQDFPQTVGPAAASLTK